MSPGHYVTQRQVWARPTVGSSDVKSHCTPVTLSASAVITIDESSTITLASKAFLSPECTPATQSLYPISNTETSSVADLQVPFYASTIPQIYAIATATVISYMLLIMLVITPRTFFVGGTGGGGGGGFLGQQGIIGGVSGRKSVVGIGGRPWLQKLAALTVVISLTVATANTFEIVKKQYEFGYIDASALRADVVGSLEVRIIRLISDAFLWLAQVQTLIRLFPRHREKVIIKWAGFALIILDTIFAILNNFFVNSSKTKPRKYVDAIPALAYLFQLALSLLYAAWIIYYSCSKRRFAFYHPKMRNICLVAVLALAAVLIPVVFFVLDISKPNVAGWGDYFRWVGAAAASVVVWEWVERIETLERDEKKDGILGREIFDGDEMLEVTPSLQVRLRKDEDSPSDRDGGNAGVSSMTSNKPFVPVGTSNHPCQSSGYPQRVDISQKIHSDRGALRNQRFDQGRTSDLRSPTDNIASQSLLIPPPATATPVSRSDTTSAASTEYAVHYHPMSRLTPPVTEQRFHQSNDPSLDDASQQQREHSQANYPSSTNRLGGEDSIAGLPERAPTYTNPRARPVPRWQALTIPFHRRRATPPPELAAATSFNRRHTAVEGPQSSTPNKTQVNARSKLGIKFMAAQVEKKRTRAVEKERERPIVVVPAQPRGRTWSPETLESVPLEHTVFHRESSELTPADESSKAARTVAENNERVEQRQDNGTSVPDDERCGTDASRIDVRGDQLLSQRGSLLIAEARYRLNPQRASSQSSDQQRQQHMRYQSPPSQGVTQPLALSQAESSSETSIPQNRTSSSPLDRYSSTNSQLPKDADGFQLARNDKTPTNLSPRPSNPAAFSCTQHDILETQPRAASIDSLITPSPITESMSKDPVDRNLKG